MAEIRAQQEADPVQSKKIEGQIMADGLIHATDGNLYFQDHTPVSGVNMHGA